MIGFGDYHAHMFSEESFGGTLFHGSAYTHGTQDPEEQVRAALPDCDHTRFPNVKNWLVVDGLEPNHCTKGHPDFETWPAHDTMLHQQMYIDWVYRAYRSGLRLIVVTITNAESLCGLANRESSASCNDMEVVDAQLTAIHRMLDSIKKHEASWMQLAENSSQARAIIEDNRLAVVIGIEVDTPFDCGDEKDPGCKEDVYGPKLDALYDRGVRQFSPVHLIDNGFGGAAIYDERFNVSQRALRGTYMKPRRVCAEHPEVDYQLQGARGVPLDLRAASTLFLRSSYDPDYEPSPEGQEGHCNSLGLTDSGKAFVTNLMQRAMLIDLDHLSERSIGDTVKLAEAGCIDGTGPCYPLMASHSWFRDLKGRLPVGSGAYRNHTVELEEGLELTTEMQKSAATLNTVAELGGVVGLIANQGPVRDAGGQVPNDCDSSSKSVAQALHYAVKTMNGRAGVGFGTDFNGLPGQPSPRFGEHACGSKDASASFLTRIRQTERLPYPFVDHLGQQIRADKTGGKTFDFNEVGLAHYGLLPDMIADMEALGAPPEDLDTLFRSAEAYVEMWAKAESAAEAMRSHQLP